MAATVTSFPNQLRWSLTLAVKWNMCQGRCRADSLSRRSTRAMYVLNGRQKSHKKNLHNFTILGKKAIMLGISLDMEAEQLKLHYFIVAGFEIRIQTKKPRRKTAMKETVARMTLI